MANKVGAFEAPATAFTGYTPPTPALIRGSKAAWSPHEFSGGAAEMAKATSAASWNQVFLNAFSSGVTNFYIQDGIYPFRDVIGPNSHPTEFIRDGSYDITCGRGAQFVIGSELGSVSGSIMRFATSTVPTESNAWYSLHWRGGTFRSELSAAATYGVTFMDISYFGWTVEDVFFDGGVVARASNNSTGAGYVDSAIVTHQDIRGVSRNNKYRGFFDTAIYPNGPGVAAAWVTSTAYVVGDSVRNGTTEYVCQVAHTSGTFATDLAAGKWAAGQSIGLTGHFLSDGDEFFRCNKGINSKRSHRHTEVRSGKFMDCHIGVMGSAVTDPENTGYRFDIHNNIFKRIERYCVYLSGDSARVIGNEFEDWSRSLYDYSEVSPSYEEAPYCAIRLNGCPRWLVGMNHARMREWAGGTWASKYPTFLAPRAKITTNLGTVESSYGRAFLNQITDVHRVYSERSTLTGPYDIDYNIFENREMATGSLYADNVLGPNSHIISNGQSLQLAALIGTTLTIASGVVTATARYHIVDTESAAATDDLDTINFSGDGAPLVGENFFVRTASSSRDVTLKVGTGNILGTADKTLGDNQNMAQLVRISDTQCMIVP